MSPAVSAPLEETRGPARLRVAMIVGRFSRHLPNLRRQPAVGLLELGHIYSVSPRPARLDAVHPVVLERGLMERTRYAPSRPREGLAFVGAGVRLLSEMARKQPRALPHLLNVFAYREDAWGLRLLSIACLFVREPAYDVVHCQFGNLGRSALALCDGGLFDGALVDISRFVQRRGPRVYDRLFERGDAFFTNSRWFEQRLHQLGCPAAKVEVLYSGIDLARFPRRTRTLDAGRPLQLVTVGRLAEKKEKASSTRWKRWRACAARARTSSTASSATAKSGLPSRRR